ncbi:replicative DNA helicase [Limibacillus sp. MBR-115]|jgi:replicative DNA helicase|uniref:replicative DNA helicase n=1 Tax=Limibacillus sp. MBR-115 TaxID=3156465 RepID=UPI003398D9D5
METGTANIHSLRDTDRESPSREIPVNFEAEQALLGALLSNNDVMERISDYLAAEHFADPGHNRIFAACKRLIERGQLATPVTLKNYFEQAEELSEVGGAQYLAKLAGSVVSIINASDYAQTIYDLHLRRQLIGLGEDVVNEAFNYDLEMPAVTQIELAEEKLYRLAEEGQSEADLRHFSKAVEEAVIQAELAFKRDGQLAGVATGLRDLDQLLGGLHSSDLLILAGRPAMGKTALATNIAFNAAKRLKYETDSQGNKKVIDGAVVGFFSLEMSAEQLATRIMAEQSDISSEKIRRGDLSEQDFNKLVKVQADLERLPVYIDDTPAISVSQLRTRARRLKRRNDLGLIVVDYLQLMRPTQGARSENRVQEISDISRGLKAIAKELNVPVLALSQLSRAVEQREDKRPQLSDLRESGSIEQDADVVMFVFREQYYLEKAEPVRKADEAEDRFNERHDLWKERCEKAYGLAEVIIGKQRHGPTGKVTLHFEGSATRFSDYTADDHLPERY